MAKNFKKLLYISLYVFLLLGFTSCSYNKTVITLGSAFDSTWPFNESNNFEFDENLVEVKNGRAQLKPLDLEHSGLDFNNGTHVGSHGSGGNIMLLTQSTTDSTHVNMILPGSSSNLVGYWRFDGDFTDSSTNTNDGTSVGGTNISSDSKTGTGAGEFDGNDDHILISHDSTLSLTNSITLSLWISTNSLVGNDGGLVSKSANGNKYFGISSDKFYELGILNNNLSFQVSDGTSTNSVTTDFSSFKDGRWHHIVASWAGSPGANNLKIYINGSLVSQANSTISGIQNGINDLDIGGYNSPYNYFGKIDEVAIWTTSLASSEVQALYEFQNANFTELSSKWTPKWDNIVGYWKMDGNWQDSSGKGNHGSPVGDPVFDLSSVVGEASGDFDGTSDRINIGTSPFYEESSSQISIIGWYYIDTATFDGSFSYLLDSASGNPLINNGFSLFLDDRGGGDPVNGFTYTLKNTSGTMRIETAGEIFTSPSWYHIGVTYDGSQINAYVNGEKIAGAITGGSGDFIPRNSIVQIGSTSGSGSLFVGNIDDLSLFQSSLSSSEIALIYNRQKQKYAGHYDSEVIDLGGVAGTWPDLSWSTSSPFGKELVGDFDNDGSSDSESSSDYSGLNGDLSNGLIGLWNLNETVLNGTSGGLDYSDSSGNGYHAEEIGGNMVNQIGVFDRSIVLDGNDDYIEVNSSAPILRVPGTVSFWMKASQFGVTSSQPNLVGSGAFFLGINGSTSKLEFFGNDGLGGLNRWVPQTTGSIKENEWQHIVVTFENSNTKMYINSENVYTGTDIIAGDGSAITRFGARAGPLTTSPNVLNGNLDEIAVWNRPLLNNEIRQLYRRGANRIKLQVKSCVDSSCNCKSFGAGGSETDCDGDTILNAADNDDIHKSEFIGPGGDGTTFYSELYNRITTEVSFSCALNTTDSNPGVCVEDEITLTGSSKPTGPEFLDIDYTQFVKPTDNRYAQYRVYMEADENTACGGEPCLPELSSVSLNPSGSTIYSSEYVEVKPSAPINFTKLYSMTIDADSCAMFRLARAGTEYYYDSGAWTPVATDADRSPASHLENNILQFESQFGPGALEVIGYLKSNASQNSQCSIDDIDVRYK